MFEYGTDWLSKLGRGHRIRFPMGTHPNLEHYLRKLSSRKLLPTFAMSESCVCICGGKKGWNKDSHPRG
jgi:hypothetical protein